MLGRPLEDAFKLRLLPVGWVCPVKQEVGRVREVQAEEQDEA